jgi:hypothetical protein
MIYETSLNRLILRRNFKMTGGFRQTDVVGNSQHKNLPNRFEAKISIHAVLIKSFC